MKTKHLFIQLLVQDGEQEHTHNIVHSTLCDNIQFAVIWYATHFWGEGEINKNDMCYIFDNEVQVSVCKYEEITPRQANFLNRLFYYPHNTKQI